MNRKTVVLPVLAGLLAPTLAACGTQQGSSAGGDPIVVGTTDHFTVSKRAPAPFDPAAAYDVAAWSVMRNTFQTLLRSPRTGTTPVPEAADRCGFTDTRNEQYRCTLRKDLTFSNGHALDAKDVAFSLQRVKRINHKGGPAVLFGNLDRVEALGKREIAFHLKKPDATFPYKLTTPAAAVVDSETYPADSLTTGSQLVGSGPYALDGIDAESATLSRNPHYKGGLTPHNDKIELRFFGTSRAMEKALKDDKIDVMGRTISPGQVSRLDAGQDEGIELVEQPGQEIRYLAFDTKKGPTAKKAVRQAMAQLVDRKEIVRDAYDRSAEPLYSLVPAGLTAHRNSFFNKYGEPDLKRAESILRAAGIDKPVKLTLTYTTDHYGDATAEEFALLKRQLNRSGLFDVRVKGVKWDAFRPAATGGRYAVWGYGWYADFPDADNFIAPFFEEDNFLGSTYTNRRIRDTIIPQTRRQTERSATADSFGRAQDIVADEVPVLPLWQGKQYLAARDDITGVEWALNSSSVLQLWELGRGHDD
ncbi:ABC transporter substrate-binding protein [Streptomyces sp. enrichment culture]|uniref:ABC transporter substrate-binding protein n=1 Tax=Streptomyces sp. enrichment culture TaxID=1795815 RepID=UPI003F57558C